MLHLITGLPGAGKTVVAEYLEKKLPAARINTDEIFTKLYPNEKPPDNGDYTSEQLSVMYVSLRPVAYYLATIAPKRHFIMEGTFRKKSQRDNITDELDKIKHPYQIILVEVDDKILIDRIQKRFEAGESHSTVEAYQEIKRIYEKPEKVYSIENSGTLKDLHERLDKYIEKAKK